MDKSLKFKNIEKNLVNIFSMIYENENIGKYIYYLTDDPLSEPPVPIDLKEEGYLYLNFFDESIPEAERIRLFLTPNVGILNKSALSDMQFIVEIVMPIKYVVLNGMGQLRGLRILDEITQMIDGQNVAGVPKTEVTRFDAGRLKGTQYCVFAIEISVKSPTYKG